MRSALIASLLLLFAGLALAHGQRPGHPHRVMAAPELLARVGPDNVRVLAEGRGGAVRPEDMLYALARAEKTGEKLVGTGTCLVILFEWTDHLADQLAHPSGAYADMMFSSGVTPTGSMHDYYQENSYGLFGVQGLIHGWTLSTSSYASIDPTNYVQVRDMIAAAIAQLDPVIDYSLYDNDGPDGIPDSGDDDGSVDALFFVHAGPGREQTGDVNDIWSHAWAFGNGLPTADGVDCYRYSVEPEMLSDGTLMTIGVFAHEYGHVLGLPDLYDTDYSSSGIGNWGLMSGGSWGRRLAEAVGSSPSHLCAWSKMQMGWLTPVNLAASTPGLVIPPVETNPVAYRIWRSGVIGDEYFLLENRRRLGFDEGLVRRQVDYGLAAPEGLALYRIDETQSGNANEAHRLVDVIEASPWFSGPDSWIEHLDGERDYMTVLNLSNFNRGDDGDLWPGSSAASVDSTQWVGPRDRDRFADDTIPNALDSNCDPTGIALENIALVGIDVSLDVLLGAKSLPVVGPDKTLSWNFEVDAAGWKFCNSFVHHDAAQSGSCTGTGGLWFGTTDPDYLCPPGYGNGWNDFTWQTVAVVDGATVTLRHHYNLEPSYDFGHVEVRCANDPDSPWVEVALLNGLSSCVTDTWVIPSSVITDCDLGGAAVIDIRLRLSSDGAWSAEDGNYCGIGWWVDEVTVTGNVTTDVDDLPGLNLTADLLPATPNPFNPSTSLRYHVPAESRSVTLDIYDQRGRIIRVLETSTDPGWQESVWDGRDQAAREVGVGVYFARLAVDGKVLIQKLAFLK